MHSCLTQEYFGLVHRGRNIEEQETSRPSAIDKLNWSAYS
jgi:hypothetical protein